MARDDRIDTLLREWAQWLTVGDGSGYSRTCTLHSSWSPPTPGTTPTLKVAAPTSARMTGRAVAELSDRLQSTLVLYYCTQLPVAEQAQRLGCQPDTVAKRIQQAHQHLRSSLMPYG